MDSKIFLLLSSLPILVLSGWFSSLLQLLLFSLLAFGLGFISGFNLVTGKVEKTGKSAFCLTMTQPAFDAKQLTNCWAPFDEVKLPPALRPIDEI